IDRCTVSNQGSFHLGFYYLQHKQPQEAEPYLRRAVQQDPSDDLARRIYAHCLEKLGRLTEAAGHWRVILRHNPTDGAARLNLGRLEKLMKEGQDR
ncbi:MAG: tetratricopeptide repeat protein, partial [Armatimonadetes bacterium]|nr:tetratricopeptide repeat protein [Armatimonadota bacterium]